MNKEEAEKFIRDFNSYYLQIKISEIALNIYFNSLKEAGILE